jgi:Uri superfamily endonuclease
VKGSYILILRLEQPLAALPIGRLGCFDFAPGCYLYVGSAFGSGGLAARLAYHQRRYKARPHWHIDYLRAETRLGEAWSVAGVGRLECRWCRALGALPGVSIPVAGFGSRDTGCPGHLFYLPAPPGLSLLSNLVLNSVLDASVLDDPARILFEVHSFAER